LDVLAGKRIAVVGAGRVGSALVRTLGAAGLTVAGPLSRGADGEGADVVLLCVPDREIARAAATIREGRLVGHCAGAMTLDVLRPHEAFSVHPLLTITAGTTTLAGATAAVAGATPRALEIARSIAGRAGMTPVVIDDANRAIYHASASVAANYLLAVEGLAESLGERAGISRRDLAPLVRAAVEHWIADGAAAALTGPVARGDDETVARQRAAVADAAPDALPFWDALTDATRQLAASRSTTRIA
jgi:predicted short-subunit dehydrogenase-like oxidoreductase (DUF2520 family)